MKGIIEQWNEFSTPLKVISLIMVCCIGLLIVGAIIGTLLPDLNTSQHVLDNLGGNVLDGNNLSESDSEIKIKVTCPVAWSASVSDGNSTESYDGTGDDVINVRGSDYDALAIAAHKKTSGSDQLKIEIIKDDKVYAKNSTRGSDVISASTSFDDNVRESADEGLMIKITCPVAWSASIGSGSNSEHYEGTGSELIPLDESDYDILAAAVQKKTSGSDRLKVEIVRDGKVLDTESTTEDYGVVSVSATIK